jgi:hypothetical protein
MLAMKRAMHHRSVKSLSAAILLFCCSNNLSGACARRLVNAALVVRAQYTIAEINLRNATKAFELMKAGATKTPSSENLMSDLLKKNKDWEKVVKKLCRRNHILYKTGEALLNENEGLREQNASLIAALADQNK